LLVDLAQAVPVVFLLMKLIELALLIIIVTPVVIVGEGYGLSPLFLALLVPSSIAVLSFIRVGMGSFGRPMA